jgi:hypothetical protein
MKLLLSDITFEDLSFDKVRSRPLAHEPVLTPCTQLNNILLIGSA